MEVKVKWSDSEFQSGFKQSMNTLGTVVREAMREAAEEAAEFMKLGVQEDISEAGNFGEEWVEAFHADIEETQRTITLTADMKPGGPPVIYWRVFEYGASIFAHGGGLLTWPNKSGFSVGGKTPAFISKHQVTIPKKFHLIEIVKDEAMKLREAFGRILSEKLEDA